MFKANQWILEKRYQAIPTTSSTHGRKVFNKCELLLERYIFLTSGSYNLLKLIVFGSHSSTHFQPIFDCFIPKFKLKYDDFENMKTDRVNAVVFNLHQISNV